MQEKEYNYTLDEENEVNNHMDDYVVHPAFRNGTEITINGKQGRF